MMVEVFSHSKLWLFENCAEAYKIKYIDKKWPDMPKSVELFLGSLVHESLEWLYHAVKNREIELDDLISHFANNWANEYGEDVRIRNGKAQQYFDKGVKFLIDYYMRNKPFDEETLDIEKPILFSLNDEYKVRGFIDRIVLAKDGVYEVHDYKTNRYPKTQEQADADKQLAFYHLGMKEIYGEDVKVRLVWHFLSHDLKVVSQRSEEELVQLKLETLELIEKIKNNSVWKGCGKSWCDWCAWKKKNPDFKF